jgi:biopolymer transport protein ExbD
MRRDLPELNAGSMADIAFLLLIFFLVSTTLKQDQGIFTKLPKKNSEETKLVFKEKNILDVIINTNNELYVEDQVVDIENLTQLAMNFIDNGGGTDQDGNPCLWCHGSQDPTSSDHPSKALIAIDANRASDYGTYIQVLNNVHKAYGKLRDRYALDTYQMTYKDMLAQEQKGAVNKEQLQERIQKVRAKYPLLVTDSKIQE